MREILESADSEEEKYGSILNLLNLIRTKADQQGVAAVLPTSSFFKLLSNVGHNLTPEQFEQLQGAVPAIGSMVKSMDDKNITFASDQQPSDDRDLEVDNSETTAGDSSTVRKMAARAAKRKD